MLPAFINPSLLWGLPLVAVPVLIHLLNLVRQRRIDWAAMEFLLQSQRKNSTRVRLKELLLLLLRMAAVAGVVLALAGPLLTRDFGFRLGGVKTHHVVLLDDSFSMSDRWAETSAFGRAKEQVRRIADEAAFLSSPQSLTLLRFSAAQGEQSAVRPELLDEAVDAEFGARLAEVLDPLVPSQTAAGPAKALRAVEQLLGSPQGDNVVLHLLSDFRSRNWNEPSEISKAFERLTERGCQFELVRCVNLAHDNLAIASLVPARGTKAAGVPWNMELTVTNFGTQHARGVAVMVEEAGTNDSGLVIDEIAPRQSVKRAFPVRFNTAGQHIVAAHLPSDPVAVDNHRFQRLDVPVSVPVLIVDGDPAAADAHFLATALAPDGAVKTGLAPQIESPAYLNNNPLDKFYVVYLANVERLDHAAIEALEHYVRGGGGLGIFLGERSQTGWYNRELYRDGAGLFPLPLAGPTQLLVDRLEKSPDLVVSDHPIFRVFLGERNSFLAAVTVERFFAALPDWHPTLGSSTRVIASLRNGAPFAIEREFGAGAVVAVLSTAGPAWNDWGRNPSFVVAMLEMQAYLDRRGSKDAERLVGAPLDLRLDPAKFRPMVKLVPPADDRVGPRSVEATTDAAGLAAALGPALVSGVYEVQLTEQAGGLQTQRFAVNVEAAEGDLALLGREQLATRLKGFKYQFREAAETSVEADQRAAANLTDWLLFLLVALLVGEQVLAYSASYHPPRREGAR